MVFWADYPASDGGLGHCGVSVGPVTSGSAEWPARIATFGKKVKLLRRDDRSLILDGVDTTNIVVSRYVDQWPDKPSSHKSIHGQYESGGQQQHPGDGYIFLGVSKTWLPKDAKSQKENEGDTPDSEFYSPAYFVSLTKTIDKDVVYDCLRKVNFSPELAAILTCIAERESKFRPGEINPNLNTGDWSIGLFQMNLLNVFNRLEREVDPNRSSYTLPFVTKKNVAGSVQEEVELVPGRVLAYYPNDDFFESMYEISEGVKGRVSGFLFPQRSNSYLGYMVSGLIQRMYDGFVKDKKSEQVEENKKVIKKSLSYKDKENPVLWQPINQAMMARTFWFWSHGAFSSLSQVPEITKPFATGNNNSGLHHWGGYRNSDGTFAKSNGFIFKTKYKTAEEVLMNNENITEAEARQRIEKAIRGQNDEYMEIDTDIDDKKRLIYSKPTTEAKLDQWFNDEVLD